MKYSSNAESIYYPGSSVPVNNLEIKDLEEIEELETQLFLKTYEHFHKNLTEKTVFDQKYFKGLHRFAFSKLYPWAGEYRDRNISKDETVFCPVVHLEKEMNRIFSELENKDFLRRFRDESKNTFASEIAYFMCELIAIHPFFELNGRTIRLFFDMIAVYNGYDYISYEDIGGEKDNSYIRASKSCMVGECKPMETIIYKGLSRT